MGEEAEKKGHEIARRLRKEGAGVILDKSEDSLKGRLRRADRIGARYVIIFGEDEVKEGLLTVKDMTTGKQEKLSPDNDKIRLVKLLTA